MTNQPGTMKNHGNQLKTMKLDCRARIQFGAGTFWRKTLKNQHGTKRDRRRVTTALGGGRGRNKQKRDRRGVTTDLLDV